MMNTPSRRRIVAQGLIAEVEHCPDCEIMHLHLGAFSLRMKPTALHDLRDTLSRALSALPSAGNARAETDAMHNADLKRPPGGSCH